MKYFIGAHIEDPHLCFYATIEDNPHFFGKWTWADKEGLPIRGDKVVYFDTREDAQDCVDSLKKTGAGIKDHVDSIQVVELEI